MSNVDTPKDLQDELSGTWIVDRDDRPVREITWRELARICGATMDLWDSIGPTLRLRNQVHNDPSYKPIAPGAGLRKYRRWRG